MKLIPCVNYKKIFLGKYIFLDNDFLGKLLSNKDFYSDFIKITKNGFLIIDSFTEFEFKRDLYHPVQVEIREQFVEENFYIALDNQSIYQQIKTNALILSKIYNFKNQSNKISYIDLIIAGRIMSNPNKYLLITGNRSDFPPCIFDVLRVLNIEDPNSGNIRSYSVLKFNLNNFNKAYAELKEREAKIIDKLKVNQKN